VAPGPPSISQWCKYKPNIKSKLFITSCLGFQLVLQDERHKTLGCTLIVTENHLITLREDFSAPLRQKSQQANGNVDAPENKEVLLEEELLSVFETSSLVSVLYF